MSVFGWASIADAQQTPSAAAGDEATKLESQAEELVASINEQQQELQKLGDQISRASGEDVRALRERAIDLIDALMSDLADLQSNVLAREAAGIDTSQHRAMITELNGRISTLLEDSVEQTRNELEELRRSKDGAVGDDLKEVERMLALENVWLDRTLELTLGHIEAMEKFNLDTADERTFLADVVSGRAELIAGRIMLSRDSLTKIENRLRADPSSAEFNLDFDLATTQLDLYVDRLSTSVRLMEALDLDTAKYQQLLFEVTGEITTGIFSREVMAGIFKSWIDSTVNWVTHNGPTLLLKIVLFALILVVFRLLARIARRIVSKAIKSSSLKFSTLLERTALSVTSSLVMIFGLLVALSQLGFEVGPLLAGLGVAGFIVGFALQDTLSNFASGVMILLYRPYDVGDLVETAGAFGTVKDMTLVSTTILTVDHQTLVIPNSKIWGDVIKNVTAQTNRRVDMVFGIGYADDIPHAEKILKEIVESHELVLDDPEPNIRLHNLGDSSVDFIVRPWTKTDDYWEVYWDITREVKMRFDAEGISIPFPQRDVHVFQGAAEAGEE
jgi:small conductance mechanosensitive channel